MRPTFTTTDERELRLGVVSQLALQAIRQAVRSEYRQAGKRLDCPTYTMTTAAGDIETAKYDDESIKDATPEEKQAYQEYQDNTAALAMDENVRITNYVLLEGLPDVEDPTEAWVNRCKLFGIPVPDEPLERRMLYIQTAVLKTPADITQCVFELMKLSMDGRPQAEIDNLTELFRHKVERAGS